MVSSSCSLRDGPPAATRTRSRSIEKHTVSRKERHGLLLLLFILGTVALLVRGWQFYTLTVDERVDHLDFRVLGPSTSLGRAYGLAGFCMILTNLAYLLRRRFAHLPVGSLRAWLDIHTFTGLFGGLLVIFHSAFQMRSTIAVITVGSLLMALLTGLIGRFIQALTPKPELAHLQQHLRVLDRVGPGMGEVLSRRIALVARTRAPAQNSLIALLAAFPEFDRELRQRRAIIEQTVADYARDFGREIRLAAEPIAACTQIYCAEVRATAAEALLRSWRAVHRLAALLMVLIVPMHIAVAWYYGYVWALSD